MKKDKRVLTLGQDPRPNGLTNPLPRAKGISINKVLIRLNSPELKGARLGFFKHQGLGKMVRASDVIENGKESMRIEVCSEDYIDKCKSREHRRWPENHACEDSIGLVIKNHPDYDLNKQYQCFNITI